MVGLRKPGVCQFTVLVVACLLGVNASAAAQGAGGVIAGTIREARSPAPA